MQFLKKPTNRQAYAKVGIYGDTGSGKTTTAAKIGIGLAHIKGNRIAFFDTEGGSDYLIKTFESNNVELFVSDISRDFRYLLNFVKEAVKENIDVIIVDSITHIWKQLQKDYLDELNERNLKNGRKKRFALEFQDWRFIKDRWQEFTDPYLTSPIHAVICGRMAQIYDYQENESTGKKELITNGTKMSTEKELGYEPSLLIEMMKEFDKDKNRLVNKAIIEKDRTDQLNGKIFYMPDYQTFKPHFDFLNIGGTQMSIKAKSEQVFSDDIGDDGFGAERRKRDIWCEEIQGLILKYFPSQSAEDKKAKADLIEEVFGTRSWTKVESMNSEDLKLKFDELKNVLDKKFHS
ncbi:MAG: ATP-binding protein [Campylobacteraceae bacterium]|jgi:hypothetical protein|nr:ATP-binding protein [Campylobacteraceae bacterium]